MEIRKEVIPIDREPNIEWLDEQIEKRDQLRKLLVRLVALVLVIAFIPLAFSGVLYLFGLAFSAADDRVS
jgi:low temperature requirement protein LtrA